MTISTLIIYNYVELYIYMYILMPFDAFNFYNSIFREKYIPAHTTTPTCVIFFLVFRLFYFYTFKLTSSRLLN